MDTNQQQQKPGILPSLADLDKPPVQQQQQATPTEETIEEKTEETEGEEQKQEGEGTEEQTNETSVEETEADPIEIYKEVSRLRGDDFQFKFGEGIDPTTPAGLHSAMQQIEDHAIDKFEKDIQEGDPRAYSYMLHRANGGSDEDFFKNKSEVLPEWEVLKESVDLQQAFYKRSLTSKGILPDQADLIIKDAIEKNKLPGLVETEYKDRQFKEKKQMEDLLELDAQRQKREEQTINKMSVTLRERILENKNLGITIPDARRAEFLQFVSSMMVLDRETGRWYVNQEVNDTNMGNLIESLYYLNVNGNLSDIIKNKVNEGVVKRLKFQMGTEKKKPKTSEDPNQQRNNKTGIHPAVSEL
jgi:hypothetical protein